MLSEEDKTEWIDRYLDHLLSESESRQFEERLLNDSQLKPEVEAQKAVRRTLQVQGETELKAKFKKFHSKMQDEEKVLLPDLGERKLIEENSPKTKWWLKVNALSIAASLLLVLAGSSIIWVNRNSIFNVERGETASNKIFQIPLLEKDGFGYAGTSKSADSIVVEIISNKQYANHYRFEDTLYIFSLSLKDNIHQWSMQYNDSMNTYILIINNRRYPLERGFDSIHELKQE